jgi:cytoskeleton protein RodZ
VVDERRNIADGNVGLEVTPGPGSRIRETREAKGLGLRDLADRLHLNVSIVEHLEADRFDELPEPAYVRGYLRACARALDLDPQPLVAAYDAQGVREPEFDTPPVVNRAVATAERRGHRRSPYVLGGVILLAVGVLIVYGWFERQDEVRVPDTLSQERVTIDERNRVPVETRAEAPAAPPPPVTRPDEPRAEPLPEIAPPVIGDPGMVAEPERVPRPVPEPAEPEASAPQVAPEPAVPAEPEPAEAPATAELVLTFVEDSWVEIHDANDQRLLVGLMREGTERRVTGTAPYRMFLGNAPGVQMRINDVPYDPSRHARSDNTARFVLEQP